MTDTIFAVSSGRPPAAIAVVRISGVAARAVANAMAGSLPPPRHAALRTLRNGDGVPLDRALVLLFPGPHSATGEDLVELHCHGGRAVVAAVERALAEHPATRRAAPGEFTRRALTNGRIDLAEAHGLADLLAAETERERIAALEAAEGRVGRAVRDWLDRLTTIAALIEASLDFADESDVVEADAALAVVRVQIDQVATDLAETLAAPSVERLKDGLRVVIAGPPNAGKSTLLNALVERDAAIVSPVAGTTRDRIEAQIIRDGFVYSFVDTAGIRDTDDAVEAIGVERALDAIETADVILWLGENAPTYDAVWVHSRMDQPGRGKLPEGRVIGVAANDVRTIDALWALLAATARTQEPRRDLLLLHDQQRDACAEALASLRSPDYSDPVITGELVRRARGSLAALMGENATESMLDALFGRFCIGK